MINGSKLKTYRRNPVRFAEDSIIPSGDGPVRWGDVMIPEQRAWISVVAKSLLAFASREQPAIGRFLDVATKGLGKDEQLKFATCWSMVFVPWGFYGQIGASDKDQAGDMRRGMQEWVKLNPAIAAFIRINRSELSNPEVGNVIDIVACEASGAHGPRVDFLVLNELTNISGEEGQEFASTQLDNFSKRKRGLLFIAENAGYQNTWQHQWFKMAVESPRWHVTTYNKPAPWLSAEEIAEAKRRNSPKRFARLYQGVWPASVGDALDESWIIRSVKPHLAPMHGREPGYSFVAGLDIGTRRDRSALVVLAYNPAARRVRLAFCRSWKPGINGEVDLLAVEQGIIAAHQQFRLAALIYDPSQAAHMVQVLRRLHGVHTVEQPFVGRHLNTMAETLLQIFADAEIDLYENENDYSAELVQDLYRLNIQEASYGFKLAAVRDSTGHADLAIALSIALPYAKRFTVAASANGQSFGERVVVAARSPLTHGIPMTRHPVNHQTTRSWDTPPSQPSGFDGRGNFPAGYTTFGPN